MLYTCVFMHVCTCTPCSRVSGLERFMYMYALPWACLCTVCAMQLLPVMIAHIANKLQMAISWDGLIMKFISCTCTCTLYTSPPQVRHPVTQGGQKLLTRSQWQRPPHLTAARGRSQDGMSRPPPASAREGRPPCSPHPKLARQSQGPHQISTPWPLQVILVYIYMYIVHTCTCMYV